MKKIILTTIGSILLCSCGEFLTPKSQNEYVPKTIEALDEVLIGEVYPNTERNTAWMFGYNEIFSDNISTLSDPNAAFVDSNIHQQSQAKRIYGMNPDLFDPLAENGAALVDQCWGKYFEQILACNTIFDYVGTVTGDETLRNKVLAEAHLFRAFYYFNFVNIYGKPYNVAPDSPGVPIKLTSKYNPELMARNTVREVYQQVIKDLDAAESYYSKFDDDYFRFVSKPSAPLLYALRSRVALYMEDWKSTKYYAEKVMKSKHEFTLYNLNDFKPGSSPYPSYTSVENVNCETIYTYGNYESTRLFNPLVSIPKLTGINTTNNPISVRYFVASPDLLEKYDDTYDLRKSRYILLAYSSAIGPIKGYYLPIGKCNIDGQYANPESGKNFGLSFRLSEVYLNYAEACAKLGGENRILAINAMETMLSKRFVVGTTITINPSSDEDLVEFIREERRKELCFEAHRWFDQRRCGMKAFERLWYEKGVVTSVIKINDHDPAFTMILSPKLIENNFRLVQNDLWSKKY